jgi:DNA-binding transcriptional regulator YiaG
MASPWRYLESMSSEAMEIAEGRELILSGRGQVIREGAHLTRSELAREIDVDQATVWRWETGRRMPRGEAARRYGSFLKELAKVGAGNA